DVCARGRLCGAFRPDAWADRRPDDRAARCRRQVTRAWTGAGGRWGTRRLRARLTVRAAVVYGAVDPIARDAMAISHDVAVALVLRAAVPRVSLALSGSPKLHGSDPSHDAGVRAARRRGDRARGDHCLGVETAAETATGACARRTVRCTFDMRSRSIHRPP